MIDKEEISEFKKSHFSLEKQMAEVDRKSYPAIVRLSDQLKELMDGIESTHAREKNLWNPDISTKIKIAKKGARLYKKLKYVDDNVAKEFTDGNISQDIGKAFMSITHNIREGKLPLAKNEFEHFLKIVELSRKYEASKEELDKKDKILRKEQHRIAGLLAEISGLEKQTINVEKANRYEAFLNNLKKLEKIRLAYLSSLTSKPVTDLLEDAETLRDHFPDLPGKEEIDIVQGFFSEYPELGKYKAGQICEMFNFSEKKISHVCPEISKFKKVILRNKNLFEMLGGLERTDFLTGDDEKVMDFFAENIDGAKEVVEKIKLLSKDKSSCKEEYGRKKKLEDRKKELSKYSKESLERELKEITSLIDFLHAPQEEKEEKGDGFFSKLTSFFKN